MRVTHIQFLFMHYDYGRKGFQEDCSVGVSRVYADSKLVWIYGLRGCDNTGYPFGGAGHGFNDVISNSKTKSTMLHTEK